MALTQAQKDAINAFSDELLVVGDLLVKWYVYSLDSSFRTNYFKTKEEDNTSYIDKDVDKMDPGTLLKVFNGVMWPSITEADPGLQDHPNSVELTSMRGVTLKSVFSNNKFNKDIFLRTFPEQGLPTDFNKLQKTVSALVKQLNVDSLDTQTGKEALSLLFKQEVAAKLWLITQYGLNITLGTPLHIMANLNAYLGYFIMLSGWLSGTNALNLIQGKDLSLLNSMKTYFNKFPATEDYTFTDDSKSPDVQSVTASVKLIQTTYEWLQKQKTNENKDYYKGWFDRFFTNNKSTVNMLVIINERVNVNSSNEFKYSNKLAQRLKSMGAAYQEKFNITIGE